MKEGLLIIVAYLMAILVLLGIGRFGEKALMLILVFGMLAMLSLELWLVVR
jgi:hypothetical protein